MFAIIHYEREDARLRPLCDTVPLGALPLHRIALFERQLFWLGQQGVTHAAIVYEDIPDRAPLCVPHEVGGVRAVAVPVWQDCGALGAAARALEALERFGAGRQGEILYLRGSVWCEADLSPLLTDRHKRKGRPVLAVTRAEDLSERCMVLCTARGERLTVSAVCDRPIPSRCCTDTVDAGIALLPLTLIRRAAGTMTESLSFPALLAALTDSGEGCDAVFCTGEHREITDLSSYYRCNMRLRRREDRENGRGNSIGAGCEIAPTAAVTRSILMDGVRIGEGCAVDGAILCRGAVVADYSLIRTGCVLGEGAVLAPHTQLARGTRLAAHARFVGEEPASRPATPPLTDDDAALMLQSFDPALCLRLGAAAVSALRKEKAAGEAVRIGVTHRGDDLCTLAADALLCGIRAAGGISLDCGNGFFSVAAYHAVVRRCDLMLVVECGEVLRISLLDRHALPPSAAIRRRLEQSLAQKTPPAGNVTLLPPERLPDPENDYCAALAAAAGDLTGLRFRCDTTAPGRLLSRALTHAGAVRMEEGERAPLLFSFDEAGTALSVTGRREGFPSVTVDLWHAVALLLCRRAVGSDTVALPYRAPEQLDAIAQDAGITVLRYSHCPADREEEERRALAAREPCLRDCLFAAARLCRLLADERTDLHSLLSLLPPFYSSALYLDLPLARRASLLPALGSPAPEGVRVREGKNGTLRFIPDARRGLRVIADALNAEAAGELLALSRRRIAALTAEECVRTLPPEKRDVTAGGS